MDERRTVTTADGWSLGVHVLPAEGARRGTDAGRLADAAAVADVTVGAMVVFDLFVGVQAGCVVALVLALVLRAPALGLNAMLVAMALGAVWFIPSPASYAVALVGGLVAFYTVFISLSSSLYYLAQYSGSLINSAAGLARSNGSSLAIAAPVTASPSSLW